MILKNPKVGFISSVGAFVIWGLLPLYWKMLKSVPAFEILIHRIIWSCVFLFVIILFQKRFGEFLTAFKDKSLKFSLLSGLIIGGNWLLYIWAVNAGFVIETSLGYYINPIVSVLIGKLFFKERLSLNQNFALVLAFFGVMILTFGYGRFPWIAVILSFSFAAYGALRKLSGFGPLMGLQIETVFLLIPSIVYFFILANNHSNSMINMGISYKSLLAGAGVVTAVPLLLFAQGVRNLNLSTVGILQYIGPTINFLLGIFIFQEEFTKYHLVSFIFIWTAVVIFSASSIRVELKKYSRKVF